ncbi:MAG: hypothetical protein HY423_12700 [Candidatus Lambdaproteobacteria bacterium]|nr:hypothetical protein [Candidatus Lambdaproteobacteria bacterium]
MGTEEDKKERERFLLRCFLEDFKCNYPSIQNGPYNKIPDFFLTWSERRIAVEVTEYHSPKSKHPRTANQRSIDASWQKLRTRIRYQLSNEFLSDVIVFLQFHAIRIPPIGEHDRFALELKDLLLSYGSGNLPEKLEKRQLARFPVLQDHLFRIEFGASVPQWRLAGTRISCNISGYANPDFDTKEVARIVESKASKILKSKAAEDLEKWLLIVGDTGLSQLLGQISPVQLTQSHELSTSLVRCPFSRVYLHHYMNGTILQWDTHTWSALHSSRPDRRNTGLIPPGIKSRSNRLT